MRALIQRVRRAEVAVAGQVVGAIGPGLCVLVGVTHTDDAATAARMAGRVWHLRILDDGAGSMNLALSDLAEPHVLCVSQFTLYGDTSRGRRPSWSAAAPAGMAEPVFEEFTRQLRQQGANVATGRFGAEMLVELVNDGPVTIMLEE